MIWQKPATNSTNPLPQPLITRDALRGQTVSKNGSISFFVLFFFFVLATNRYINLFLKLSPLLLGMYCSDCQQANQNPFLSLISLGRGPTHPYLCDVNASFHFFIKTALNCGAILFITYSGLKSSVSFSNSNFTILKRQIERITSKKHLTFKTVEIGVFMAKESCFV